MGATGMKISVVTASFNSIACIRECLRSVSYQNYSNREHIIIDGGSTDGTRELLVERRTDFDALVCEPDSGIYDALNKGIRRATGDVVGFLHSDDVFAHARVLETIATAFATAPEIQAVYGDLVYVSASDRSRVVRTWHSGRFTPKRLAWGWMPPHPTFYVRREWYARIGGFDVDYRISADYLSILQLFSQADFRVAYIPEVLVKMTLGGASNRSALAVVRKSREDWDALRRTNVGRLWGVGALFWKNFGKLRQFF
jgi:hypothetical protein